MSEGDCAAVLFDGDAGGFDAEVFQAGEGFVRRHVVAGGVAVNVFDVPLLVVHPTAAFDDADNRGGCGGGAGGVPAEVKGGSDGFDEVVVAIDEGGDDACRVELVAV